MNIFYIPFIFNYCQHELLLLLSSLLSPLNYASGGIADDEDSFQVSPEAEFTSPLHVHIIFDTEAETEKLL